MSLGFLTVLAPRVVRPRRAFGLVSKVSCSSANGMDEYISGVVARIHERPTRAVLLVTGGAAQSASWLLGVPGASETVLEATVPYSRESMEEYCESAQDEFAASSFASVDTAKIAARAAFRRAAALAPLDKPFCGIAATCALASSTPKRGDHRCFVAVESTSGKCQAWELKFEKGSRTRWEEDSVASRVVLWALSRQDDPDNLDIQNQLLESHLKDTERLVSFEGCCDSVSSIRSMVSDDKIKCVEYNHHVDFTLANAPRQRKVILSGSFNPVHAGHREMLRAACDETGLEGFFELSATNADKGQMGAEELQRRVDQFKSDGEVVVVSKVALFTEKAALFRRCVFLVGFDTAVRLVEAKYYGGCEDEMLRQFESVRRCGCRFLVAGRVSEGKFLGLGQLTIPPGLADLFSGIPEDSFRNDISSTQLRREAEAQDR